MEYPIWHQFALAGGFWIALTGTFHVFLAHFAVGGGLYLVGVQPSFYGMLNRGGHAEAVGRENIFDHKGEAIQTVYPRLDCEICRTCTARIFHECHVALPDGTPRESAG